MTKVRGLTGKPWWWILNKTVAEPVRLLNITDKQTEITVGKPADLTVFRIETGEFTYLDSKKESRTFSEKATAVYTCTGTKVYTCR
jgi:predicted amidohydrolase